MESVEHGLPTATEILGMLDEDELRNIGTDNRLGYKLGLGNSEIYAVYWDINNNTRTYAPNEGSVRLKAKNIVDLLGSNDADNLDDSLIILHENKLTSIEEYLNNDRRHQNFGPLILYWPKTSE